MGDNFETGSLLYPGGIIGLKESLNRPAGLRTYTLVCMGSALAMVVSLEMYYQFQATVNAGPGRIALRWSADRFYRCRYHNSRRTHHPGFNHGCGHLGCWLYRIGSRCRHVRPGYCHLNLGIIYSDLFSQTGRARIRYEGLPSLFDDCR